MEYQKKERIFSCLVLLSLLTAMVAHYLFSPWGFYSRVSPEEAAMRTSLVEAALCRVGAKESDGSHRVIIARYNTLDPLPQAYALKDTDSWCAAFVTVSAMDAGLTHIIPPECGCDPQIALFRSLGCWEEADDYVPLPGDLIYYHWDCEEVGDCTCATDHVGIVVGTAGRFIKVIEGNKENNVAYRYVQLDDPSIRGYGVPNYAG